MSIGKKRSKQSAAELDARKQMRYLNDPNGFIWVERQQHYILPWAFPGPITVHVDRLISPEHLLDLVAEFNELDPPYMNPRKLARWIRDVQVQRGWLRRAHL